MIICRDSSELFEGYLPINMLLTLKVFSIFY
jgi:hypothetical protein